MTDIAWPVDAVARSAEFWLDTNVSRSTSPFTREQQLIERTGEHWRTRIEVERYNSRDARAFDAFLDRLRGGVVTALVPEWRRQGSASPDYQSLKDFADTIGNIAFDDGSYFHDMTEAVGDLLTEDGRSLIAEDGSALQDEVPPVSVGALLAENGDRLVTEASGGADAWAIDAEDSLSMWSYESDETPELVGNHGNVLTVSGLAPEKTALLAGDMIQGSPGRAYEVLEDVTTDADGRASFAIRPTIREDIVPGPLVTSVTVRMRLVDSEQPRNPTRVPVISTYTLEFAEDLHIG